MELAVQARNGRPWRRLNDKVSERGGSLERFWDTHLKDRANIELDWYIFERIIIEHKDYKSLWRKRTTDDGEPINHNQVVRAHGEKVFETIKLAITSIDDLKGLSQTLSQMGYEHYKLGVRSEHYQVSICHLV